MLCKATVTMRLPNFQSSRLPDFWSRALSQCSCANFETSFKPFQIQKFVDLKWFKRSFEVCAAALWQCATLEVRKFRSCEVSKSHCDSRLRTMPELRTKVHATGGASCSKSSFSAKAQQFELSLDFLDREWYRLQHIKKWQFSCNCWRKFKNLL